MNAIVYHTAFRTLSVHCPTNHVYPKSLFFINHRGGEVLPNRTHLGAVRDPKGQRMQPAGNLDPRFFAFGHSTLFDTLKREEQ
jgi:hypothetical protein